MSHRTLVLSVIASISLAGISYAQDQATLTLGPTRGLQVFLAAAGGPKAPAPVDVVLTRDGIAVPAGARPRNVGSIAGRVTDLKTQSPLAGATVLLLGRNRSATTGSDGRYRIADVAPGTYTVRARYIGYAPGSASVTVGPDHEATADFVLETSAQRLDEVVTTGTVVPTEVKVLPTPISILGADDIAHQNLQRVDQVFRGDVPGAIAWDLGPGSYNQSTVSVRGATALTGIPGIKTFVDGVEVANPAYIATIDPNSIDRIEITRGPQASTLYGAGALSGVMQLFTKKGQLGLTRPEVTAKISAGGVGGFNGQPAALQTDNSVSILGGVEKASYNVNGSYRNVGDWVPSYRQRDWSVSAGGQMHQGPLTLSGLAHYASRSVDSPWDTRFATYTSFAKPPYLQEGLAQQTYGLTATLQATRTWQHALTLGYDQSYFSYRQTQPRFTTPTDSLLNAADIYYGGTSVSYHTDLSFGLGRGIAAIATAGVNYAAYNSNAALTFNATHTTGVLDGIPTLVHIPGTNTGYFGQVQFSIADRLFLTGGLRAERNDNFGTDFGTAWSPRVGAAYSFVLGPARVKLRASYGESIRAPDFSDRFFFSDGSSVQLANASLAPERQRGADGGIEVYVGRASLGMTYYNQRAIDLIQEVPIVPPPAGDTLPTTQFQNVSRVKNEGWEFEGKLPLGALQLSGTFTITNSTVQALPPGYPAGGYQVGDAIVGIPHTSAGATVAYAPGRNTSVAMTMTYFGHWINRDVIAMYGVFFGGQPYRGSTRAYWIEYPTVTKFGVSVSQMLRRDLTIFARVENVGNNLRPENLNTTIPTPRSLLVGATVRY